MNYSKQREIILNYLKSVDCHPTAETIYENIKEDCPSVSLATVYRNLNQLSENNYIRRIKIDGKSDRFDGNLSVHNHLFCRVCGKIEDMEPVYETEEMFRKVEAMVGFVPDSCQLLFSGICKNCRDKQNNQ